MRGTLAALVILMAACGPSAGTPSATVGSTAPPPLSATARSFTPTPIPTLAKTGKVTMGDNYFQPEELIVAVGATVTWEVVAGDAKHDVVSADRFFNSNSPMNRGDLFTFTFTTPGEYKYICSYHIIEGMTGKIVVK